MSCGVDKLMERGAVIRCAFRKLCQQWKHHAVCAGLIIRPVSLSVFHLHARALHIATYDGFGVLVCAGRLRKGLGVFRRQPFALVDVEHAVIAQKGNGFLFARFLIRLLHHLPEHNHAGLFTLAHIAALLLYLPESCVFTGAAQQHLIQ